MKQPGLPGLCYNAGQGNTGVYKETRSGEIAAAPDNHEAHVNQRHGALGTLSNFPFKILKCQAGGNIEHLYTVMADAGGCAKVRASPSRGKDGLSWSLMNKGEAKLKPCRRSPY